MLTNLKAKAVEAKFLNYHVDIPLEVFICGADPIKSSKAIDLTSLITSESKQYGTPLSKLFVSANPKCPIVSYSLVKDK